ncbi:tripartite tricarboxylate transporter substrate binding protein [Rhodoferax sp. TH121]|uniref:tripartite tricarboxylate transporter substrate binding protein n=1 Tax=Rhodoferax sp. TH121 TaxID=2022803 RepID=UPI0020CF5B41|nr:tripartite tricarboxylate transporter substrate binding protein [Rhodoferax sp. TH121]
MGRKLSRRTAVAAVLATALLGSSVSAQNGIASYPDKPVKIVVPFAPGAGTDAMGRLMAQKLGDVMGGSFVVENRTGASGAIGTQYVAQQPADGYTLLLVASPFTTVAASLSSAGYDPIKSFTPVGMIASGPLVWATNHQTGIHTMQELVAYAKQKPGVLNYGSAGAGGVNHLVLELLKAKTGTFITHIPYRGVAPAALDMVSGQVQLVTGTIPALLPLVKDGRIKPLAVTSAKRSSAMPEVPSMAEAGFKGFDVLNYFALAAPAGTPAAVIEKLNAALNKVVLLPEVQARFKLDAVEATPGSPMAQAKFIEADYRAWREVVQTQNLKIE